MEPPHVVKKAEWTKERVHRSFIVTVDLYSVGPKAVVTPVILIQHVSSDYTTNDLTRHHTRPDLGQAFSVNVELDPLRSVHLVLNHLQHCHQK